MTQRADKPDMHNSCSTLGLNPSFGFGDRIGLATPGHVAATDEQARTEFWPHYRDMITKVSATRGFAISTEASFQREIGPGGSLYVGSPETVAAKIAANLPVVGATRFDLKYGIPGMTDESLLTAIRLYGEEVVPRVRELLAQRPAA